MATGPLLDRDDVTAILETLFDIRADVRRVISILEEDDEEEEETEDDA